MQAISYRALIHSSHPAFITLKRLRRKAMRISVPAPRFAVVPLLWCYLLIREALFFVRRVFLCEPLLKAYCTQYGRGVTTDIFPPWVAGRGDIILGDNVHFDGIYGIGFSSRYCDRPTLRIGNNAHIGTHCTFTVAKSITVGSHCYFASHVTVLDSPGHPIDPDARLAGMPPPESSVQPVIIGDNVWIGQRVIVLPGVTIGDGSVVGAGSIVTKDIPAYTLAAGNPARVIRNLR